MELVSVVIPVYNSSKTLVKCLDSIVNQTYKNIEIICINDGSTDNSLEILNSYVKKDKRFLVVSDFNQGVSHARNVGIKKSNGEYLMFIDSDDYIDIDYISKCVNLLNNNNVSILATNYYLNDIEALRLFDKDTLISFNDFSSIVFSKDNLNHVWAQLIKTSVIKKNKIKFNEKIKYGEDLLFNKDILSFTDSLLFSPINGYHYVENDMGITSVVSKESLLKKIKDSKYVYDTFKNFVDSDTIDLMLLNKIHINLKKYISDSSVSYADFENILSNVFSKSMLNRTNKLKIIKARYSFKRKVNLFLLAKRKYKIYYNINKKG